MNALDSDFLHILDIRDHSCITSAKGVLGSKMAVTADIQCCIYADNVDGWVDGWVKKVPKMCCNDIWMVPYCCLSFKF